MALNCKWNSSKASPRTGGHIYAWSHGQKNWLVTASIYTALIIPLDFKDNFSSYLPRQPSKNNRRQHIVRLWRRWHRSGHLPHTSDTEWLSASGNRDFFLAKIFPPWFCQNQKNAGWHRLGHLPHTGYRRCSIKTGISNINCPFLISYRNNGICRGICLRSNSTKKHIQDIWKLFFHTLLSFTFLTLPDWQKTLCMLSKPASM